MAFVDLRDLAEVATLIFEDPAAHRRVGYTLTGPVAVTFHEVASLLSDVLDRTIRYEAASVPGYLWHVRRRRDAAWGQAVVQAALHTGLRFGQAEIVDPTLEQLLRRPPRSIRDYIADHRSLWASSS